MKEWEKNLRKITPYIPGEQSKNSNIIKLNANENPYPPSLMVLETLRNFDSSSLRLYPSSTAYELKEELAKYHKINSDMVFLGNGSDEVIALSFMAFFNSQKPIVFPDITYSFYPVWCSLYNIPYKTIPLDEDFKINPKDYAIENGGVIIPNPNAPTGIGEGKEFIENILQNNQDVIVIIDEAYVDFSEYSCIELLNKYENLIIIHTFSKSRSLAGARIGAAFGNSKLISVLESVKNSYNSYTIDTLALKMGVASIIDDDYFKSTIFKIKSTREKTIQELSFLGFKVYKSNANFILVTHSEYKAKDIFEYLKNKNIFVRYFDIPRIDNHIRITIGTDREMSTMIEEIKRFFSLS